MSNDDRYKEQLAKNERLLKQSEQQMKVGQEQFEHFQRQLNTSGNPRTGDAAGKRISGCEKISGDVMLGAIADRQCSVGDGSID